MATYRLILATMFTTAFLNLPELKNVSTRYCTGTEAELPADRRIFC